MAKKFIKISTFAARRDVSVQTVRRWERLGKIPPAVRDGGGPRYYPDDDRLNRVFTTDAAPKKGSDRG